MIQFLLLGPLSLFSGEISQPVTQQSTSATHWRFVLESPGGELPFLVQLEGAGEERKGRVLNGEEAIEIGQVKQSGAQLRLRMAPYDSELVATISANGKHLSGKWSKSLGGEKRAELPLTGVAGVTERFPRKALSPDQQARLDGRWAVQFASDEHHSVGSFQTFPDGRAHGTFETTLGDYRFLAGTFDGQNLQLSCFDGGHAFLFKAKLTKEGELIGDFWSRDSWHEGWTAKRDADAQLPDPFGLTTWNDAVPLSKLVFPDLEGTQRSLADEAFEGRARLISLFGTWCPNCNDEAVFLAELDERYGSRGLSIVGLAFELDEDFKRSVRQVRRFQKLHGASYPVLIAGTSNKKSASAAFPALDRVRAFPTAILLDKNNQVRAIHTGFSGPATGKAYEHMRERYESLIEQMLKE